VVFDFVHTFVKDHGHVTGDAVYHFGEPYFQSVSAYVGGTAAKLV